MIGKIEDYLNKTKKVTSCGARESGTNINTTILTMRK